MESRVGRLEREALKQATCRYSNKRTRELLDKLEAGIQQARRNAVTIKRALKIANARRR